MMNHEEILEAANSLEEAEVNRVQMGLLSLRYPKMTMDDAYAIQEAWINKKFSKGQKIANLLKDSNLVSSTSEALRMIKQGAVKMDGEKVNDKDLTPNEGTSVYQVGKRKFARVTIS